MLNILKYYFIISISIILISCNSNATSTSSYQIGQTCIANLESTSANSIKDIKLEQNNTSLTEYINSLELAGSKSTNLSSFNKTYLTRLSKVINYYKKIDGKIDKTYSLSGVTIDCIPFSSQPAIINNPTLNRLNPINKLGKDKFTQIVKMNQSIQSNFNAAKYCPYGDIALVRPTIKQIELSEKKQFTNINNHKKSISLNQNLNSTESCTNVYESTPSFEWYNYRHIMPLVSCNANGSIDFNFLPYNSVTLDIRNSDLQFASGNYLTTHNIMQIWVINTNFFNTVEFGIIKGAGESELNYASYFAFASVDNYGESSCYAGAGCTNIIIEPNAPVTLNTPVLSPSDWMVLRITNDTSNSRYNYQVVDSNGNGSTIAFISYNTYPQYSPGYFNVVNVGAETAQEFSDQNILTVYGHLNAACLSTASNSSINNFDMLNQPNLSGLFHFDASVESSSDIAKYLCMKTESTFYLLGSESNCLQ